MRTIIGVDEENIEKVWDRMVTVLAIIKRARRIENVEGEDEGANILAPMIWTMSAILDRENLDIVEEIERRLAERDIL